MPEEFACAVGGCTDGTPGRSKGGRCNAHQMRFRRYGLDTGALALVDAVVDCQACGTELKRSASGRPPIDHDHDNGHVRGVLCNACNVAEGCIRDLKHAKRILAYVERTRDPNFDWVADRLAWLAERSS